MTSADRSAAPAGVLDGITVLELCEVFQGPLAGQTLGDFGARVIKIERPPQGDPLRPGDVHAARHGLMSSYFAAANRNKESVCLDLKSAAGREAVVTLARSADVLLHNYRPGALERLGLGHADLARVNPRLIYAAASGFGQSGPLAGHAGQDLLIQSISGIAAGTADGTGRAAFANVPLTDYASGMLLVQGVLLALLERNRSGLGQQVTVSLFDTAISMQSLEAASLLNYGVPTRWFDLALNFAVQAADGWLTVLGFFRDNPLQLICRALALPDLSEEMDLRTAAAQLARRNAIVARLQPAFRALPVQEAVARLQQAGVLAEPLLELEGALALPQVAHNGMIRTVPVAGQAPMRVIDHPLRLSRTPHTVRAGPPALGAQTAAVLAEFGIGPDAAHAAQSGETGR
ncbi:MULTISPECIES: CaiB/BaiF CoA transferase family protein [Cupriavidus]